MSAQAQSNTGSEEKLFFFYPGHNEQFPRRVLAGLLDGNTIHVSEAVCFPGHRPRIIAVKLMGGGCTYVVDPGIPADTFVKKEGKALAVARVRGWKDIPTKDPSTPKKVYPGQQLIADITIGTDEVTLNFLADETAPTIVKPVTGLPVEGLSVGKAFVEGIEAYLAYYGFPVKPKKVKKVTTPGATAEVPAPKAN
jgi:hypothetical protein